MSASYNENFIKNITRLSELSQSIKSKDLSVILKTYVFIFNSAMESPNRRKPYDVSLIVGNQWANITTCPLDSLSIDFFHLYGMLNIMNINRELNSEELICTLVEMEENLLHIEEDNYNLTECDLMDKTDKSKLYALFLRIDEIKSCYQKEVMAFNILKLKLWKEDNPSEEISYYDQILKYGLNDSVLNLKYQEVLKIGEK